MTAPSAANGRKTRKNSDKSVVVADAQSKRIDFLSRTYEGRLPDKSLAGAEGIEYPPGTVRYKGSGFQGYEPPVAQMWRWTAGS